MKHEKWSQKLLSIWRWLTPASGELGTCGFSTDTEPGMLHIPDSPNFTRSQLSAPPHLTTESPGRRQQVALGGMGSAHHHVADENKKHQAGLTDRTDWLPVDMKPSLRCDTHVCLAAETVEMSWASPCSRVTSQQSQGAPEKTLSPPHNEELTQAETEPRASRPG